jgi:hypothetical protein
MVLGCGDDPPQSPGRFGEVTSAVVVVNPVIKPEHRSGGSQ